MYFQHFQYSIAYNVYNGIPMYTIYSNVYNGKAAKSKQTNKSQASTGVYLWKCFSFVKVGIVCFCCVMNFRVPVSAKTAVGFID